VDGRIEIAVTNRVARRYRDQRERPGNRLPLDNIRQRLALAMARAARSSSSSSRRHTASRSAFRSPNELTSLNVLIVDDDLPAPSAATALSEVPGFACRRMGATARIALALVRKLDSASCCSTVRMPHDGHRSRAPFWGVLAILRGVFTTASTSTLEASRRGLGYC